MKRRVPSPVVFCFVFLWGRRNFLKKVPPPPHPLLFKNFQEGIWLKLFILHFHYHAEGMLSPLVSSQSKLASSPNRHSAAFSESNPTQGRWHANGVPRSELASFGGSRQGRDGRSFTQKERRLLAVLEEKLNSSPGFDDMVENKGSSIF